MRIAITGANGFVGSNLANHFLAQGHEVKALVRAGADTSLLDSGSMIVSIDYSCRTQLRDAFHDVELIIHNAGRTRTLNFKEMILANVVVTRRVIDACNASPQCRRLIYLSSLAAGKPSAGDTPISEEEGSAPVDWYGRSKLLAERLIGTSCVKNWTVIRPSSVYGPGERDFLQIFKAVKAGISFHLGREPQLLSLIHVDELCRFVDLCLHEEKSHGQVFYASDGEVYTHTHFTGLVAKLLGVKTREFAIPIPLARAVFHLGDLYEKLARKSTMVNTQKMKEIVNVNWICSVDKARQLLGWEPLPDLESNLRFTLDWYKREGWL